MTNKHNGQGNVQQRAAVAEDAAGQAVKQVAEKTISKKAMKEMEGRVEKAYYRTCEGVQINILDIPRVFKVGVAALIAGADEPALEKTIKDFVETIRKN